MDGILGQPYLVLDDHLDLSGLDALHEKIIAAIDEERLILTGVRYHMRNLCYNGNKINTKFYEAIQDFNSEYGNSDWVPNKYFVHGLQAGFTGTTSYANKMQKHTRENSVNVRVLPEMTAFADTLPFTQYGRLTLFITLPGVPGLVHSDIFDRSRHRSTFIWLNPTRRKQFFLIDDEKKVVLEGHRAFLFNTRDYHGTDPTDEIQYSIRIDGEFTKDLERKLGIDALPSW